MKKEKKEYTTVAISKNTFSKLLDIKHDLESENKKSFSFDATINHLIDIKG